MTFFLNFHCIALGNSIMPRNLAAFQHALIRDMVLSKSLKGKHMATIAGCSDRTIRAIASNLHYLRLHRSPIERRGTTKARYAANA
jgi:hypothetical protein